MSSTSGRRNRRWASRTARIRMRVLTGHSKHDMASSAIAALSEPSYATSTLGAVTREACRVAGDTARSTGPGAEGPSALLLTSRRLFASPPGSRIHLPTRSSPRPAIRPTPRGRDSPDGDSKALSQVREDRGRAAMVQDPGELRVVLAVVRNVAGE